MAQHRIEYRDVVCSVQCLEHQGGLRRHRDLECCWFDSESLVLESAFANGQGCFTHLPDPLASCNLRVPAGEPCSLRIQVCWPEQSHLHKSKTRVGDCESLDSGYEAPALPEMTGHCNSMGVVDKSS